MAKKRKWTRRDIPHCADPENHVLVKTRESIFWRKKRKKGVLNDAFATNVDLSRISGPAARQVVQKLRPFFKGLVTGRVTLRISNGLRKALKEKKRMEYSFLQGLEVQRGGVIRSFQLRITGFVFYSFLYCLLPVDDGCTANADKHFSFFILPFCLSKKEGKKDMLPKCFSCQRESYCYLALAIPPSSGFGWAAGQRPCSPPLLFSRS